MLLTPSSSAPILRVAIYRTSSLGDVVLATACLDLLSQLAVPTETTWLGRGAALDVIKQSWPDVRTLEISKSESVLDLQKLVDQLAASHLFIDLQCNLRSQWLRRNLKLKHDVSWFATDKSQLARNRLILEARLRSRRKPLPEDARTPRRLQFATMGDTLKDGLRHHLPVEARDGLEALPLRPRLPIPDQFDTPWRKELRFGAWLAVAPGAAHPTKQAPLEIVREIIGKVRLGLSVQAGAPAAAPTALGLVFLGDNNDRQVARLLTDQLNWSGPVLNLAGRLSLWETAVALRETTCLLSNDSSLGHIAEAVDTPAAVLFGPTIESFGFAPRMRQSRAFSALLGCRPCSKHGKVACRYGDKLCFTAIVTDDVANWLLGLLAASDARHRRRLQPLAAAPSEVPPAIP